MGCVLSGRKEAGIRLGAKMKTDKKFYPNPSYPRYLTSQDGRVKGPGGKVLKPFWRHGGSVGPFVQVAGHPIKVAVMVEDAVGPQHGINRMYQMKKVMENFPWMRDAAERIRVEQNKKELVGGLKEKDRIRLTGDESYLLIFAIFEKVAELHRLSEIPS